MAGFMKVSLAVGFLGRSAAKGNTLGYPSTAVERPGALRSEKAAPKAARKWDDSDDRELV
jgi:hypothetical protein